MGQPLVTTYGAAIDDNIEMQNTNPDSITSVKGLWY